MTVSVYVTVAKFLTYRKGTWPRGYKKNFMLNVAEHENSNAHHQIQYLDKPRMLFFLLIHIKMPTIVGILTFMRRKNFMFS